MPPLPRLALATSATDTEPSLASLALLGALAQLGWRVQHFRSWACPLNTQVIGPISGLPGRHLDPWLMPPDVCRALFTRGARGADLALVEGIRGEFMTPPDSPACVAHALCDRHGELGPLIDCLDLPLVVVVDCRGWNEHHLPFIPPEAEAVILDGVDGLEQGEALRASIRMILGIPVLGMLADHSQLRQALTELPTGHTIPTDWVQALADQFAQRADFEAIRGLAESRPAPCSECCEHSAISCHGVSARNLRVAYAMDDAFGGYFPDTLETLELLGAKLFEFSPLSDEDLPKAVDLVMIGCGFPDLHAERLSSNHSLIAALRAHVCGHGGIYTEGGGTAYLCRSMIFDGRQIPGAGIFPIDAELQRPHSWPEPVVRTLCNDGWLGSKGTVVRGYRSNRWVLTPSPDPHDCNATSGPLTAQNDIVFRKRAVGSLIHLHLAALPQVVSGFVGTARPASASLSSRILH